MDPVAAVCLIGTNDLGNGFSPEETAESVAAVARETLRCLPRARLAVTLITPRTPVPSDAWEGRWERWEARLAAPAAADPRNHVVRQRSAC